MQAKVLAGIGDDCKGSKSRVMVARTSASWACLFPRSRSPAATGLLNVSVHPGGDAVFCGGAPWSCVQVAAGGSRWPCPQPFLHCRRNWGRLGRTGIAGQVSLSVHFVQQRAEGCARHRRICRATGSTRRRNSGICGSRCHENNGPGPPCVVIRQSHKHQECDGDK